MDELKLDLTDQEQVAELFKALLAIRPYGRCQPLQGTLNRMISPILKTLRLLGHSPDRFVRNYENSTANYVCSRCHQYVDIDAKNKTAWGGALISTCGDSNS